MSYCLNPACLHPQNPACLHPQNPAYLHPQNPACLHPQNPDDRKFCQDCGASLRLGDRYRAIKPIGSGGFGRTFLAVDEYLPSHPSCVIKQLFPPKVGTRHAAKAVELFHREAEQLDQLGQHPQIPKLLAHFTQNTYQYLIQSYIGGSTLAQELAQTGGLDQEQIRQMLQDLLPVLQFIHERQVIHRDIKPENIVRQRSDGKLILVDFGASKYTTLSALGKTGTVIGSAGYAAPEQVGGRAIFASDIYSLGVTCIHLLTDVSPFDLFSFADGQWSWHSRLPHPIAADLTHLLDRMVAPAINQRYASAADVLRDLAAIATGMNSSVPMVSPAVIPLLISLPIASWQCTRTLDAHDQCVAAIAISPDGKRFASASFDRTIKLWHLDTATLLGTFTGHLEPVLSLAFSPDGTTLVSGSIDDTIKLWDLSGDSAVRTLAEHSDSILSHAVAISPDGQAIVSGSDDNTVKIWQLSSGRLIRTLRESRAVTSVAISPNGRIVASGSSSNRISLWNLYTGDLLRRLSGHSQDVNSVAFSANGQLLVSGSSDNSIRLWNFQTQKVQTLTGHLDWVNAIALSADDQFLASGSRDHTIKLWSLPDGELRHTLTGHTREVKAIAFSPNSQTLISGSGDRTIRLWRR